MCTLPKVTTDTQYLVNETFPVHSVVPVLEHSSSKMLGIRPRLLACIKRCKEEEQLWDNHCLFQIQTLELKLSAKQESGLYHDLRENMKKIILLCEKRSTFWSSVLKLVDSECYKLQKILITFEGKLKIFKMGKLSAFSPTRVFNVYFSIDNLKSLLPN